jgi:hypothetical protein
LDTLSYCNAVYRREPLIPPLCIWLQVIMMIVPRAWLNSSVASPPRRLTPDAISSGRIQHADTARQVGCHLPPFGAKGPLDDDAVQVTDFVEGAAIAHGGNIVPVHLDQ